MGKQTAIAWTDHTFNPWWGCVRDGPECDHCYAEAWAKRTGFAIWGHDTERRFFGDAHWGQLRAWNRAAKRDGVVRKVFVASMCDVFERMRGPTGDKMNEERARLWPLIEECDSLIFQLLTKRPQNMLSLVPKHWALDGFPRNVWAGTTAGTMDGLRKRGKFLKHIPARVRFLSCEPQLESICLRDAAVIWNDPTPQSWLHWLITGGESGGHPRGYDLQWARDLVQECRSAGIAPFVKQLGRITLDSCFATDDGMPALIGGMKHKAGADPSEWPEPFPQEFPEATPR